MSQALDVDGNALLEKYGSSQKKKQRLRKNVQLLFLGLSAEETAPLITLLRTSRISPRGKQVNTEQEFLDALSERSWDLILCTVDRDRFTARHAANHLKRLDKDIPIIQIIPSSDSQLLLQGLKNHLQAVVPLDEKELVLINVRRELDNLDSRRRLRKTEAALAEAGKRNLQLMRSSKHAIVCCTGKKISFVNESFLELFGYESSDQVCDKELVERFSYEERPEFVEQLNALQHDESREAILQLTAQRTDRSAFTANIEMSAIEYEGKQTTRILFRVDDHHVGYQSSEQLDPISGLFNKEHLNKQLEQTVQHALRGGHDCSLVHLKLDAFANIQQQFGNDNGEQLIRDTASLLSKSVNKAHPISHPTEDAFVIIFNDPSIDNAQNFAQCLCNKIAQKLSLTADDQHKVTCSIGIALINDNAPPIHELLSRAEGAALSLTEEGGSGNGVHIHTPEVTSAQQQSDELANIRKAIEDKAFKLLFQPIVSVTSEDTEAQHYEALLRLVGDEDNEISPSEFMSALNDAKTALKVDRWVIEHCLRHLKRSLNSNQGNTLFINISAHTLEDKKILPWLAETLRRNKIPGERLIFQISENDISLLPKQAQNFTDRLQSMHCGVCIKHFGSSAQDSGILRKVRADYIKLDGSYIQELGNNSLQDEQFFTLIEELEALEKTTIAPLVECTKAMATLWKAGVDYVQGYYLQPPRESMDYDFFAE